MSQRARSPVGPALLHCAFLLLAACGGGGGKSVPGTPEPASFAVGGTISGLTGSGLILLNNGGDPLAIASNGSFTFAGALADAEQFAVTVQVQPTVPAQTCAVINGNGMILKASFTSIEVKCAGSEDDTGDDIGGGPPAPALYSVGGAISGLAGAGLVLRNNDGDDLQIAANGLFAFAAQLLDAAKFNITVATQPSHPQQACTVVDGSGSIAAADIKNVQVSCVTTEPLVLLNSTPTTGAVEVERQVASLLRFSAALDPSSVNAQRVKLSSAGGTPEIALDVSTDELSIRATDKLLPRTPYRLDVSNQVRGVGGEQLASDLQVTFTTRDAAWQSPQTVVAAGSSAYGQSAIDRRGNVVTAWTEYALQGTRRVWAKHCDATSACEEAVRLDIDDVQPSSDVRVQIATDADGNAVAVWTDRTSAVWARRYDATAATWGPMSKFVNLAASGGGSFGGLQLAVAATGHAWAIWQQLAEDGRERIFAAHYAPGDSSQQWQLTEIQDVAADSGAGAQIAAGNDGAAIAVWHESQGLQSNVVGRVFDGQAWLPTQQLNLSPIKGLNPQVGLDASGNALVVWAQPAVGMPTGIWYNRYSRKSGWSDPAQIVSQFGNYSDGLQLAVNARGNALLVWLFHVGGVDHVMSSQYSIRESLWSPFRQVDKTEPAHSPPGVALDDYGNGLVLWEQANGSAAATHDVLTRRYLQDGDWGEVTVLGQHPTTEPDQGVIAINASGDAVATWTDHSQIRISRFE